MLPNECCSNVGDSLVKLCGKKAAHWYRHNGDICAYCDEHNYECGKKILPFDVFDNEKTKYTREEFVQILITMVEEYGSLDFTNEWHKEGHTFDEHFASFRHWKSW